MVMSCACIGPKGIYPTSTMYLCRAPDTAAVETISELFPTTSDYATVVVYKKIIPVGGFESQPNTAS